MSNHALFEYTYRYAGELDAGKVRSSNQDQVICLPEYGFFAVSDGMGGLSRGKDTSEMIRQVMPDMLKKMVQTMDEDTSARHAAELLKTQVESLSDTIFEAGNRDGNFDFGATLSGVWLIQNKAVFVNLGDSRGYHLSGKDKTLIQVTRDHNVAGMLVEHGDLTKSQAKHHPTSSQLVRFAGMDAPAKADTFIIDIQPEDQLLLCSDGLHGMTTDADIKRLMGSSRSPKTICRRLIDEANENGGRDNISVIDIAIGENVL